MLVGAGGDLGQMGYRQHLAVRTQLLHQPPHRVRHRAADAGVDLVKYQRRRAAELAGANRNGQGDTREFATRGHFAHSARRAACVPGHQKLHLFPTAFHGLRGALQRHHKLTAAHAQVLHGAGNGLGQQRRGLGAGFRNLAGFGLIGRACRVNSGLQAIQVAGRFELRELLLPLLPGGEELCRCLFVAARQRDPQSHAGVQLLQARGVQVHMAQVGAQGAHGFFGLRQGRVEHLRRLGKARFNALLRLHGGAGRVQPPQRAAIVTIQRIQRALGRVQKRLAVGQAAVLSVQAVPLVGLGLQFVDFADLPQQLIALVLQMALRGQCVGVCVAGRLPGLPVA